MFDFQESWNFILTISWTCLWLFENMFPITSVKGVTVPINRIKGPNKCPERQQKCKVIKNKVATDTVFFSLFPLYRTLTQVPFFKMSDFLLFYFKAFSPLSKVSKCRSMDMYYREMYCMEIQEMQRTCWFDTDI